MPAFAKYFRIFSHLGMLVVGSKIFLKYFWLTQQIPLSIIGVGAQVPCLCLELEVHLEHVDDDKHDGDVELRDSP